LIYNISLQMYFIFFLISFQMNYLKHAFSLLKGSVCTQKSIFEFKAGQITANLQNLFKLIPLPDIYS